MKKLLLLANLVLIMSCKAKEVVTETNGNEGLTQEEVIKKKEELNKTREMPKHMDRVKIDSLKKIQMDKKKKKKK